MIAQHQNIIHKVSRMYRDRVEDCDDLFQDIVFQLWRAYPNFRGDSKPSTWIYKIALNTGMAIYRKKSPSIETTESLPEIHANESSVSENEEMLYDALHQLSTTERAIVSLYLEGYNYSEIGSIIGISENYTGVKINRIKKKLKEILK
nr:sigma-70 family RNA polymerase sigma factor [Roseivirga sp. E12]